jgi:hypothetical protein
VKRAHGVSYFSPPYEHTDAPARPLHIDQLPPDVREVIGHVRLPMRFTVDDTFQPCEHMPCVYWEAAYVTSDGKTVCPIPGCKEEDYRAAVEEELRQSPELRERFRFEG